MKDVELLNHYFESSKLKSSAESAYIYHFIDTLYRYGKECEGGHIAEIGVDTVISSWTWLKSNPKKITLCDISFDRAEPRLTAYKELCVSNNIDLVLEEQSSLQIELKDVDLLFIDGLHTYDHVLSELRLFNGSVKRYMILHDTIKFPKINDAKNVFLNENKEWALKEHIDVFPGLTILERVK